MVDTRVGFMGGDTEAPSFEQVASGSTGHAEVVEVCFDPARISFADLLRLFWDAHDPTASNRLDPQPRHRYRSAIFFHDPQQEAEAQTSWLDERRHRGQAPLTEIVPATTFWPAGEEHQQRLERRGCRLVGPLPSAGRHRGFLTLPPKRRSAPDALVSDFGEAFGEYCSSGHIHAQMLHDETHVSTTIGFVRQWLAEVAADLRGARNDHGPDTGSDPDPLGNELPAATPQIQRVQLISNPPATSAQLLASTDRRQLCVTVNLLPGNFHPLIGQGLICYAQMLATPDPSRPGALRFVGHGGSDCRALRLPEPGHRLGPTTSAAPSTAAGQTAREHLDDEAAEAGPGVGWLDGSWHEHVPELRLPIPCQAGSPLHELRWGAGELLVDARCAAGGQGPERTLRALGGGARGGCWTLHDAWSSWWFTTRWLDPLGLLQHEALLATMVGARGGPAEVVSRDTARLARALHQEAEGRSLPNPAFELDAHRDAGLDRLHPEMAMTVANGVHRLIRLLPPAMQLRWVLGGLAHLHRRYESLDPLDRIVVHECTFAALRMVVFRSVWNWVRPDPSIVYGRVELRFLDPQASAWAEGSIAGDTAHLTAAVPFRWLTHVWARGLGAIDDHLVLEVDGRADADELDVVVVGWRESGDDSPAVLMTRSTKAVWNGVTWHLQN